MSNIGIGSVFNLDLRAGATQVITVTPSSSQVVGYVVTTYPSDAPVTATEIFRYEQGGTVLAELGVPQLSVVNHYSFPVEINSSLGIFTGVALANPSFLDRAQTLVLSLINLDGSIQKSVTVPLQIGQQTSLYLNQKALFEGLDNFTGSISISSPEGTAVVALRQDKQAFGAISTDKGPIIAPFAVTKDAISEVEPNNGASEAQSLLKSTLVTGTIGAENDLDTFKFTGKRGDIVSVICDTQGLSSSLDCYASIADSNLQEIAYNDDSGLYNQLDSFVQAVLPADGAYYIVVYDYDSYGGPDYTYRLHITLPSASTP
jgi:hypothetical protein